MQFRLLIACLLFCLPQTGLAASGPNILFFLVDDMGTQDTSQPFLFDAEGQAIVTENNRLYRTPNIQQLARQGRLFNNAYAYSVCSPTRVSLLTGLAAPRHRVTTWTHPTTYKEDPGAVRTAGLVGPKWNTRGVPEGVPLLPKLLAAAGYQTLFAGKAHFGPNDTPNGNPKNLGFEVNIAGHGAGGPGGYQGKTNYSAVWRNGGSLWDVPGLERYHGTDTFLTEALTLEMADAIRKAVANDKPFFAYMGHYAVHAPFETDARFAKNYPQLSGHALAFATLVEGMDRSLGDLLEVLRQLDVAKDTLVVFYSDNGSAGPLGSAPLRGKKGTRFEGGLRVPLITAWAEPDATHPLQRELPIPAGSVESRLVTCLDLMPTMAAVADVRLPSDAEFDGRDIRHLICGADDNGDGQPEPAILCHFPHGRHNNTLFTTYRKGDWKLIYQYASRQWEMYNLRTDVGEQRNCMVQNRSKAHGMAVAMLAELHAMKAQFPRDANTGEPVLPDLAQLRNATALNDASSEAAARNNEGS